MPIDLSKLSAKSLLDTEINPREIFNLLSDKDPRYQYPRDVQSEVWEKWLGRRQDRDVVIKMNTGGGKTLVGLLTLKSCLNEGVGPAVYVTPDKYLTKQVLREAADLGLMATDDPRGGPFLSGKAILVTNIHQLVNGLSIFGTAETGIKLPINAILVDDAHACLATTESQFTLSLGSQHPLYSSLLKLFRDDLMEQNETKLLEFEAGAAGEQEQLVPFWAWHAKSAQATKLILEHRDDEDLKYKWPLVKNHLDHCRCIFSGTSVEIAPRCLPMDAIPSFTHAKRRIFMTATLADDSILVSDFNAHPDQVRNHLTPAVANDIGQRMILIPQEIDPDLSEADLKQFLKGKSAHYNTVVIVPSEVRLKFWQDVADLQVTAANLEHAVEQLKTKHVGLVVMVNKYDGIDLPGDACRILVLDGLPLARRLCERVERILLADSQHAIGRQMQRIEQGMGRGVRGNDDHCAVLLMGASLIKTIFLMGAKDMLSPATRAQLAKSEEVAKQLTDGALIELDQAIETAQTKEWKKVAREAVSNISYPAHGNVRSIATAQRQAFDHAVIRDYAAAERALQTVINAAATVEAPTVLGWLKWQLAEYVQFTDPVRAQQILKSALQLNRRLTLPIDGLDYEKLHPKDIHQARSIAWKVKPYLGKSSALLIQINGMLDDLSFRPDNANEFEAAMQQLAEFLGFEAQRPEVDFKRGPDVLWLVGNLRYFVIECKSGAINDKVSKHYANQLTGSMQWFAQRYDQTCEATPVLVHPSRTLEAAAAAHASTRILTQETLDPLKDAVRGFYKAISASIETLDAKKVQEQLEHFKLTPEWLLQTFTQAPKTP